MAISINKQLEISGGIAPFEYTWRTNADCQGCVSITPVSGTTNKDVTATLEYNQEDCFNDCQISLLVTDSAGCETELPLAINNPCLDFNIGEISYTFPFTYTVTGEASYTYKWSYDTAIFNRLASANNRTLNLELRNASPAADSSVIKVKVSDSTGCEVEHQYTHTFCKPTSRSYALVSDCDLRGQICLEAQACEDVSIDWSTLNVSSMVGITTTLDDNCVSFSAASTVPNGTYTLFWDVADTNGFRTTLEEIDFQVKRCAPVGTTRITIPDLTLRLPCEYIQGDSLLITLEDKVQISSTLGETIDWSTVTIVSPPESATSLVYDAANRRLVYTVPDTSIYKTDVFSISVCSTGTVCSNTAVYTVVNECINIPVLNDMDLCAVCGNSVSLDLTSLLSSTGAVSWEDLQITQGPSSGSVSHNSMGLLTYNPLANFAGSVTIKVRVPNTDGNYSDEVIITVDVICAGSSAVETLCS